MSVVRIRWKSHEKAEPYVRIFPRFHDFASAIRPCEPYPYTERSEVPRWCPVVGRTLDVLALSVLDEGISDILDLMQTLDRQSVPYEAYVGRPSEHVLKQAASDLGKLWPEYVGGCGNRSRKGRWGGKASESAQGMTFAIQLASPLALRDYWELRQSLPERFEIPTCWAPANPYQYHLAWAEKRAEPSTEVAAE